MASKQDLRKQFLQMRDQLPTDDLKVQSEALSQHLLNWAKTQNFEQIAAFQSFHQEPLIDSFLSHFSPEQLYFPVVQASRGHMDFYRFDHKQSSQINRYGIKEPSITHENKMSPNPSTLILIPALAFDRQGYRLGYGAGYYDRFLKDAPGVRVGICLEQFLIDKLPRDAHDLPVQHLATERQFYRQVPFLA